MEALRIFFRQTGMIQVVIGRMELEGDTLYGIRTHTGIGLVHTGSHIHFATVSASKTLFDLPSIIIFSPEEDMNTVAVTEGGQFQIFFLLGILIN